MAAPGAKAEAVRNSVLRALVATGAIAAVSYIAMLAPRGEGHFTPIGLGNAVLLAMLLTSRRSRWTAIAAGGFAGRLIAGMAFGEGLETGAAFALVSVFECLACAVGLNRVIGRNPDVSVVSTYRGYILVTAAASVGGGVLVALPALKDVGGAAVVDMLTWAARDFTAMNTVTACLVVLARQRSQIVRLAEVRSWPLLLLLGVEAAVFFQPPTPLAFLVLAGILLVTWRMRVVGTALAILLTLAISVTATLMELGPFSLITISPVGHLLSLQAFLTVCFYVSVPVAAELQRSRVRKAALAEALQKATEAEARLRLVTDNMRDIIVLADRDGVMQWVSPSVSALGYAPEDVIGRNGFDYVHPDDLPALVAAMSRIATGGPQGDEYARLRFRDKDGRYRWMAGSPSLILDESGEPAGTVSSLRDLTKHHEADEALVASEARYRLLADNMNDIVAWFGDDGVFTFVSGASERILGYTPEEMVGRSIPSLIHPDDAQATGAQFRRVRESGVDTPFRAEFRAFHKDGRVVWLEANPRAYRDAEGRFLHWQDVIRDVTDRKALETDLRAARAEADAGAKMKAEFLADMSHEIRGPLNSVLGFARLTRARPGLREPIRTYVERMEEASRDLLVMVNDILDFSRLEAREVEFRPRPVVISEFAHGALAQLEPQARAKDLALQFVDRTPPGLVALVDYDRVRQVVLNLVGNGVKFTQAGQVKLTVDYDAAAERLLVEVRDTGPGIPLDRMDRLFRRFSQVHRGGERIYPGAGLGLAISRRIVEGLGGEITVESQVSRGAAFSFWIPAPACETDSERDPHPPRLRVLVADPDPAVRELAAEALAPLRVEVLGVEDGEAALALAARETVDVIVLALDLPKRSGPQTLRRLRARRGPNMTTPVLACAPADDPDSAGRALDDGFQGLVAKPFLAQELISAIAFAASVMEHPRPRIERTRTPRGTAPDRPGRKGRKPAPAAAS